MLANFNYLLKQAINDNYAIGIAEVWDLNTMKAGVEAAIEENSPFGILSCQHYIEGIGLEQFRDLAFSYINSTDIPIALCLYECNDINFIFKCIKAGFTFVMFDGEGGEAGSNKELSFEENVNISKKIVEFAHLAGVTIEASLGKMPMAKGGLTSQLAMTGKKTNPEQALEFVSRTGIDILAPSIGNIHCAYEENWPEPDWDLAKRISDKINIPLSLHGGSGATDEQLKKAISVGFKKINMGTRYDDMYRKALMEELNKCEGWGCSFDAGNNAANKVKAEIKRLMHDIYKSSQRFKGSSDRLFYMTMEKVRLKSLSEETNEKHLVDDITEKVLQALKHRNYKS